MSGRLDSDRAHPAEGFVTAGKARLYYRALGRGWPVIVLHGGPDFDHNYLLPQMDRLAERLRVVYYDQRGRGRSAAGVRPDDVSMASEIEDLDRVRRHFDLDRVAVLGHSWGGVLAMAYTAAHPDRVSHLLLVNTAPASGEDAQRFADHVRLTRPASDVQAMKAIAASSRFRAGDPDVDAEFNRIHFRLGLRDPDLLAQVTGRLRTHSDAAGVLLARAIERRLYAETWDAEGYDLVPRLREIDVPTLVIHGRHDAVPVPLAARIADAIPRGRLEVFEEHGHFVYLEAPEHFCAAIWAFIGV